MSCSNNLKQVGLALHNYHAAFEQLPKQMGGTFDARSNRGGTAPPGNNRYRQSFLVGLLPFIEQQAAWEQLSNPTNSQPGTVGFAPMGPAPWTRQFDLWQTQFPTFRCPSDPGAGLPGHGRTNVTACLGDATHWLNVGATRWNDQLAAWVTDRTDQVQASGRGVFVPRQVTRFKDIHDGLANTILCGEIRTDLGDRDITTTALLRNDWQAIHESGTLCRAQIDPERPRFWAARDNVGTAPFGRADQRRGFRWADGAALYTGFNTILPPNTELCLAGGDAGIGMAPPSSNHHGGCHIVMADGAVIFMTDSVDAGDSDHGTVKLGETGARAPGSESPFGLWGALGTKAMGEQIDAQLNQ